MGDQGLWVESVKTALVVVVVVVFVVAVVVVGGGVVLVSSRLVLSCPCLILSCLLFVSSWGSCGVIFGRLGGPLGSFLVVLGVVLGSWGGLGPLLGGLGSS